MKRKLYVIIKYLAITIFCGLAIAKCCNLLYKWNGVPLYRHIVYLYHPMTKDTISTHFVNATIDILADELPYLNSLDSIITPLDDDQLSIKIKNKGKEDNMVLPYYSKCDDSYFDFFDIQTNLSLKKKLHNNNYINEVANVFAMLHFKSEESCGKKEIRKIGQESHSALVLKSEKASSSKWLLETEVKKLHLSCQEKEEQKKIENRMFDFNTDSLFLKSYYLFSDQLTDSVCVKASNERKSNFVRIWNLLTSDFDITKAQYNLIVLSEAIDSLDLCIYFNDIIKLSPISVEDKSGIRIEKGSNFVKLYNIKSNHTPNHGIYRLFKLSDDLYNGYNAEGIYNNARYNNISFFAQRISSEKIQWIRLFVLSSLLAYLVSIFFLYLHKLLRAFKALNKDEK